MAQQLPTTTEYIYKIVPSYPKPSVSPHSNVVGNPTPVLPPSTLDISSNYIHMSTANQVAGTIMRFFATSSDERNTLYILRVSLQPLEERGVVRWESPDAKVGGSRDGEGMFPHLYFNDAEDEEVGFSENSDTKQRRLWIRKSEVESMMEVVSEMGSTGWEDGLKKLEGWLI